MKFFTAIILTAAAAAAFPALAHVAEDIESDSHVRNRKLTAPTHRLRVTNLAYQQPFSPFFVMVHDGYVDPLYEFGQKASNELAALAEDGNAMPLVKKYRKMDGVCQARVYDTNAPYFAGSTATIPVRIRNGCEYVTIATMAINTNDCFISLSSQKVESGQTFFLNGLDAGSEVNDESCANIPGPACGGKGRNTENAEGVVHVHRGVHGFADLTSQGYDWRNPMAYVVVEDHPGY